MNVSAAKVIVLFTACGFLLGLAVAHEAPGLVDGAWTGLSKIPQGLANLGTFFVTLIHAWRR